jgi:hypothetical protein
MGKTGRIFSFPLLKACAQIRSNFSGLGSACPVNAMPSRRVDTGATEHSNWAAKLTKTATAGDHAVVLGAEHGRIVGQLLRRTDIGQPR